MLSFKHCAELFRRVPPAPNFLESEPPAVRQMYYEILCPLMAGEPLSLDRDIPGTVEDIRRLQAIYDAKQSERRTLYRFYQMLKTTEPLLSFINYI